ncbi:MAG: hypothetical protein ACT4QC_09735 [Planctomycetaceae bacterium]
MSVQPGSAAAADLADLADPADSNSQTTSLVLEVTRGSTRFRRRPVTGPRFLIGAGVTCDLRIGGEGMPALHSLITIDVAGAQLEAIAATPALVVNGRRSREARLRDGDIVRIGDVELIAHIVCGQPASQAPTTGAPAAVDAQVRAPAEMSAGELVELIEREEREVERFEKQRAVAAKALLQTAITRGAGPMIDRAAAAQASHIPAPHFLSKRPQVLAAHGRTIPAATEAPFISQLAEVGRELSELSREIQTATARAGQREAGYAQAADALLETQQHLAGQLKEVVEQVQALHVPPAKPRAIA